MYTLLILSIVLGAIVALINRSHVRKRGFVTYSLNPVSIGVSFLPVIIMIVIVSVTEIVIQVASHPANVATPAKYTNQNYYIDTNDNLYVDHNGKMRFVEKPEQQLIQYNELAKSATVEFKTTKKLSANMSKWIPFHFESKTKTSISKITLPKAALTEKLTKVDVLNTSQSDASDLSVSN